MPIPKPLPKEQNNEFIQRCMMDDTMVREYDQDQRYAICREQLQKHENASKQSKNKRG
jgi:hypothetical protein